MIKGLVTTTCILCTVLWVPYNSQYPRDFRSKIKIVNKLKLVKDMKFERLWKTDVSYFLDLLSLIIFPFFSFTVSYTWTVGGGRCGMGILLSQVVTSFSWSVLLDFYRRGLNSCPLLRKVLVQKICLFEITKLAYSDHKSHCASGDKQKWKMLPD